MSKNKISFKKGDIGDQFDPSDSEDDYTEREKKLLEKVRKGRKRDVDPEQELMAFAQHDDEEDEDDDDDFNEKFEADSDIDDQNDDDGIPDSRAWGKNRKSFYSTDFVDQDFSSYSTREEDLADQEEAEARAIQQRLAKQLEESDFTLDVFNDKKKKRKEKSEKRDETYLRKDLSSLSQREKEQLFKKESPEFEGLVSDFERRMEEKINIIEPALAYFNEHQITHPIVNFVNNLNQLILSYCTNVSFYLVLKSKRVPIKTHPIVKRLVQIRQLLQQLEEKYESTVKPQLELILQSIDDGVELKIETTEVVPTEKPKTKKKLRFVEAIERSETEESDVEEDEQDGEDGIEFQRKLELAAADSDDDKDDEQEDEEGDGDERREITYQIAKNKGLTPFRKKELRNPRVKHRNKFRKALIRRKGAVRTVRKETTRYDGEKFGIKASVKKGIKIK